MAQSGADMLEDALAARLDDKPELVSEILEGTLREDGRRSSDGLLSILPKWARGAAVLDALVGAVVLDDSVSPPTVSVHWERVPTEHRLAAASLASELVDAYYGRPKGGRPRKNKPETG